MHSDIFFQYSHHYKELLKPSYDTIRVNPDSFDQIIKLNIKRQLKMKRFQSTSTFQLSMMKALLLFYFLSLSWVCYMAQMIWIHNYWSRFNLDQSIMEFKILPLSLNFRDTVPHFFLTHCLIVQQILSLHNTFYIPKDIQHITKNCTYIFHNLSILFFIFNYMFLSRGK